MIAIVNYGSGNIQAVANIYKRLDLAFRVAEKPADLADADRIVLPGVGAFDQAMIELDRSGMRRALDKAALEDRKPILGICVGMQLMAHSSEEGSARGLGWIDGVVRRLNAAKLPHMGWNTVDSMAPAAEFYFLHSYYFSCCDPAHEIGFTTYGAPFASVIQKRNIFGVQFHPEKSHQAGIDLLNRFATLPLRQCFGPE